jgi:hypothetical protein
MSPMIKDKASQLKMHCWIDVRTRQVRKVAWFERK